jgi:hypothetical protein
MPGIASADQIRAAQLITGVTMAIWIATGFVPPLQRHAATIRRAVLIIYLLCCAGFIVAWLMA